LKTLNQWIQKFCSAEEQNPHQPVLIAEKYVMLTATQAIRFDQITQLRNRGESVSQRDRSTAPVQDTY